MFNKKSTPLHVSCSAVNKPSTETDKLHKKFPKKQLVQISKPREVKRMHITNRSLRASFPLPGKQNTETKQNRVLVVPENETLF
jgi:hypothetical protein